MAKKITSATKLVIPCRISFANIFEPKSINGSEAKYSVSCLIPKDDKKTLLAILRPRFRASVHQRQRAQVQLLSHHPQERYRDHRENQGSH